MIEVAVVSLGLAIVSQAAGPVPRFDIDLASGLDMFASE